MNTSENCPCGSSKPYTECCGPFIEGTQIPDTAEKLMRSRYSAYTLQDDKYLLETWHSSTRPEEKPSDDDDTKWTKLEILHTEKGLKNDTGGGVEFLAQCKVKGNASHIHETSNFLKEDGRWYYVDAQVQQPVRRENPKIGRNDPCSCGSNKKYKKCCGR
jgi:SEC-C motif-containing protein